MRCSASCETLAAGVEYPEEGAAGLAGMGSYTARGKLDVCCLWFSEIQGPSSQTSHEVNHILYTACSLVIKPIFG